MSAEVIRCEATSTYWPAESQPFWLTMPHAADAERRTAVTFDAVACGIPAGAG